MAEHEHSELKIKFGTNRGGEKQLGNCVNVEWSWGELVERCSKQPWPTDRLTIAKYRDLTADKQAERKNVGWFVGGQFDGGVRLKQFIHQRQLICLDIDNGTPEILRRLELGSAFGRDLEYFAHSTRSHGGGKIKLHVLIPLPEPVDLDVWMALARVLAHDLDPHMILVDKVSFVPAQVMYWPSTCADVKPVVIHNRGELIEAETYLDEEFPAWRDVSELPHPDHEDAPRPHDVTAGIPTEKPGWIGAFNRAYDVRACIREFLGEIYTVSQGDPRRPERYSRNGATGSNGAVVYDEGQKLQSHHASDPAFGQNHAFDLARINMFGHLDTPGMAEKDEKNPAKQKSFLAMVKFCQTLPEVRAELMDGNYGEEEIAGAFDAPPSRGAPEAPPAASPAKASDGASKPAPPAVPPCRHGRDPRICYDCLVGGPAKIEPDPEWKLKLQTTQEGQVRNTTHNLVLIVTNHGSFRGVFAYNRFEQSVVLLRPIRSRALRIDTTDDLSTNRLNRFHRVAVRQILESPQGRDKPGWGMRASPSDISDAIVAVAGANKFHPVEDYFNMLTEWDGESRIDRLLPIACHTADDEYHRQVGRLMMLGAVARTFEPGSKFDFLPILEGPQGWFKSTFVRKLAPKPEWAGETEGYFDDPKKLVESTRGRMVVEIPELSQLSRADTRAVKNMLSSPGEQVRLAYREDEEWFPRRYVLWGTTNEEHYLRDDTGNRRFWPVRLGAPIDLDWVDENRDQMWAEALAVYRSMRAEKPHGTLPLFLAGDAAREAIDHQSERMIVSPVDEAAGKVSEWLDKPVATEGFEDGSPREVVCGPEISAFLFEGRDAHDQRRSQFIEQVMRRVPGWGKAGREYLPGFGRQRVYRRFKQENEL